MVRGSFIPKTKYELMTMTKMQGKDGQESNTALTESLK